MRPLALILAMCPMVVQADVFPVMSSPERVIVHPNVARVARSLSVEMPAGRHEIRLSDLPWTMIPDLTEITLRGAVLEARVFRDEPTDTTETLAGTPEVQAARATLLVAKEALSAHDDRIAEILAGAEAAKAQIAFLEGLKVEKLSLDIEGLRALGQTIASDGTAARAAIVTAEAEARQLAEARIVLQDAVTLAQDALNNVSEPFENARELSLLVNVEAPGAVELDLEYWVHSVGWRPIYRMDLSTTEEVLQLERGVSIQQDTGEPWVDVALEVTTIPAVGQTLPSPLAPRLLQSVDAEEWRKQRVVSSRSLEFDESRPVAEAAIEAPVIVEEIVGDVSASGAGVVYTFEMPITVRKDEAALVSLQTLDFDVEVAARAVPRRDETAFRMIAFTNGSGERILAGQTAGFVDGQAIGQINLATIEAGAEVETGFGPIHGLQIKRAILDKQEGDRGIIARENAQREEVRISVENLTGDDWAVTLVDQVPYSEQEELEIDWSATPRPAREDVEDDRGILEWDLNAPSGATSEVRMQTDIRWPDGNILR